MIVMLKSSSIKDMKAKHVAFIKTTRNVSML